MPSTEPRSEDEMLARTHRRAAELRHRRSRRRAVAAGLAAVLLVVGIGAVVVDANRVSEESTVFATDGTEVPPVPDAPPIPEGWTPMAASPLSGRGGAVSAWTGSELLVWRGDGAFADVCTVVGGGVTRCGDQAPADGAAYDPASDTWRMLPPAPLAEDQGDKLTYAGVWTGAELVVWGGPDGTGAAYDPVTDGWRTIAAGPLVSGTHDTTMVWTGSEVVVLGPSQTRTDPVLGSGPGVAAYDPANDRWRVLPSTGTDGRDLAAVWCGGAILVVDEGVPGAGPEATAHRYDPSTGRWATIAQPPLSAALELACTGDQLVAVGRSTTTTEPTPNGVAAAGSAAAVLDLVSGEWTLVDPPPVHASSGLGLVWTGTEVMLVGVPRGEAGGQPPLAAATLDPSSGTWHSTIPPELSGRGDMTTVWVDDELLVWGGAWGTGFVSEPAADGARYRPAAAREIPAAILEGAERCRAERVVSYAIDGDGSPEPEPTEAGARDIITRDQAIIRWDLIEASVDRRTWAGTSGGEVVVVFAVAHDGTRWLVDGVRLCQG